MDDISSINIKKDTTYVIMLEAQRRGHDIFYCQIEDLFIRNGKGHCTAYETELRRSDDYYNLGSRGEHLLEDFDVVWMRKDPPFNMDYIYATYILEMVDESKCKVINHPRGIRNSNEKLYSLNFGKFVPETIVTKDIARLKAFLTEVNGNMVVKPLEGYGGEGIFSVKKGDPNETAILESITHYGKTYVMAQKFIEKVYQGDKRIIILNGEPIGAVLRMPGEGEFRCNFHSGGSPALAQMEDRDYEICSGLAHKLIEDRLYLVGIDVVGGFLTEVNTTSPTCVQEINSFNNTRLEEKIVTFAESLSASNN